MRESKPAEGPAKVLDVTCRAYRIQNRGLGVATFCSPSFLIAWVIPPICRIQVSTRQRLYRAILTQFRRLILLLREFDCALLFFHASLQKKYEVGFNN